MAQYTELSAQLRTGTGKGLARKLKQQGKIPAILYGGQKNDNTMLSVDQADLRLALKEGAGHSLIQIKISGDKKSKRLVMLKEIQNHPISRAIHHVDFLEVSEKQSVAVSIPIILIGEATGVKGEGGILEHVLRKLNIECPANAIPENIEVEIGELDLGSAIHVEDLVLDKKITVKDDPQQTVVCVVSPKEEVVEVELEEEVEGEEAAEGEKPAKEQETAESGE
jgi:large subunit ribosomal protein L25